ncbi:luciferase [Planotetraspora thailandica]|uniref:Luciferase n=1 Tax=Planotetraspora thailandica TaxID=487172 RepID=A0A8J3XX13_9ACTN|nr:LLM class flavin-dependent oxidoreductase [Planotetraspora thailandica]GII56044.1 luciferase [Planotetraspora thailandica]
MEIGVFTFGDVSPDAGGLNPLRRLPELVEEIALADEVGLDVFGIGEHHRPDFAASAPAVVLAAAAARTTRIRLTSAVTVLSADDPVRVFEQFATLDLISRGRAEIMAGRGVLVEPFRLFGYDLADYESLFAEKVELLMKLRDHERVTWAGLHRPPLHDEAILPRPAQKSLPIWVAVGGTPQSAVRAGSLGLPMTLSILGGALRSAAPLAQIHRQAASQAGHAPQPLALAQHGFVAPTSQRANDLYFPAEAEVLNRIGRERGLREMTRADFDGRAGLNGPLLIGSPAQVAEKILREHEIFGHQRLLIQLAIGSVPHHDVMRAIELLGGEVAPAVRAALASQPRNSTKLVSTFGGNPRASSAGR